MPFVAARVLGVAERDLSRPTAEVLYQIRAVDDDTARVLSGDPTIARPLPLLRLVGNVIATFVVVLAAGLGVAATAPRLFGYGSVVVASGSMEPAIRIADVVVTSPTDGMGLGEGAVINFEADGMMVLHRITEVNDLGYRTAGDANQMTDSSLVDAAQVRGVGVVVVPFAGLPARWFEQRNWLALIATLLGTIGAMYMARARWVEDPAEQLGR